MTSKQFLPPISVKPIGNSSESIPLTDYCKGKRGVIDVWHTKCTRCPAALSALNELAGSLKTADFIFIACALSLKEGDFDEIEDLSQEWEDLSHIHVDLDSKGALKEFFGYNAVPYYIVFDKDGSIVQSGDSKSVNYTQLCQEMIAVNENKVNNSKASGNVFSLDEDF